MRKIEQQMLNAIRDGRDFRRGNTRVDHVPGATLVHLHGNRIAMLRVGHNKYTLAGWPTALTRSRLNALLPPGHRVIQRNHEQYLITPNGRWPLSSHETFHAY